MAITFFDEMLYKGVHDAKYSAYTHSTWINLTFDRMDREGEICETPKYEGWDLPYSLFCCDSTHWIELDDRDDSVLQ